MEKRLLIYRPILLGLAGTVILLALYILVLGLAMTMEYAFIQFKLLWYWMTPLVLGFGVQVGLFFYMRGFKKLSEAAEVDNKAIVASAGISTSAMIVCCLHHITDVLPIIGLTAASLFLAQYQKVFLGIGIVSNFIGFFYVLFIIKKHRLFIEGSLFSLMNKNFLKVAIWLSSILGALWVAYLIFEG